MKNQLYRIFFLVLFLNIGCQQRKSETVLLYPDHTNYPYVINIVEGIGHACVFKLSEIADSISFISLETNENVLLASAGPVHIDKRNIFVGTIQGQTSSYIYRFDIEGSFINTVGKIGRGPGEYLTMSFSIDPESEEVIVFRWLGPRDFIVFDYSGYFKGKLPLISQNAMQFEVGKDRVIIVQPYGYSVKGQKSIIDDLKMYQVFDKSGQLIDAVPSPFLAGVNLITSEGTWYSSQSGISDFTFYNGQPVMSGQNNDTSFVLTEEGLKPAFILNREEFSPDYNQRYQISPNNTRFLEGLSKYFETPKFVFRYLDMEGIRYLFRYEKATTDVSSMQFTHKGKIHGRYFFDDFGFTDDLSGGPSFYPNWTNKEGDIWIACYSSSEFRERYGSNQYQTEQALAAPFANERIKVAESLTDDSNPVIIMVHLKKYR
jgi:hypothetical protein